MNYTLAPETEAMYTLQVWPDPPNDEEAIHQGWIFEHIQKEWETQVVDIREAAAAEAEEADKDDVVGVNMDDSKQAKPKPKWSTLCSKKKKKDSSSKKIKPPHDNLNEYFGLSQSQNSQKSADVTPIDTPKKSEEAKSKNDPDGSSRRRVDKLPGGSAGENPPKPSPKLKQAVQDSADSSCRNIHKLPWGSAGEGSSGLSSKSKQSAQQTMKPESEDSSSSSSSSSSDSESLDEEKVPLKGKMKELPPPPPLKKRDRSQSPPHSWGKRSKSWSTSHTPKRITSKEWSTKSI